MPQNTSASAAGLKIPDLFLKKQKSRISKVNQTEMKTAFNILSPFFPGDQTAVGVPSLLTEQLKAQRKATVGEQSSPCNNAPFVPD